MEHMDDLESSAATGVSAVSWAAILAGAAAAVATSLTLFALAAGLNLVPPGALSGTAAASTAMLAALALIVTQWISAGLGGYLTGRLRTRWMGTHTHEVFFRDTAHGFITWCVATVFMASGLVAAASAVVGTRSHAGGTAAREQSAFHVNSGDPRVAWDESKASADSLDSSVDFAATSVPVPPAYGKLVLPDGPGSAAAVEARRAAALAGLRTRGPTTQEWQIRELLLSTATAPAEQKDAARGSMLTALSMVIGAFIASLSALLGGRQRDLHR